jgi:4'-phosphopantetheinyl transferase
LRLLLYLYTDVLPERIAFQYDAFGKPSLTPDLRPSINFNVSHSTGAAAYAFANGLQVGIDIEQCNPQLPSLELAKQFFAEQEILHLSQCSADSFCADFFRIWTLKEAFMKGLGRGLSIDLRAFEVAASAPASANWLVRDQVSNSNKWKVQPLPAPDGYMAALAVEDPNLNVTIRRWNWSSIPPIRSQVLSAFGQDLLHARPG